MCVPLPCAQAARVPAGKQLLCCELSCRYWSEAQACSCLVCWRSCLEVQQAPCAASLVVVPHPAAPTTPALLQTPKGVRSARFDVVFLDESMRITRGDRVSTDAAASSWLGACAAWRHAGGAGQQAWCLLGGATLLSRSPASSNAQEQDCDVAFAMAMSWQPVQRLMPVPVCVCRTSCVCF